MWVRVVGTKGLSKNIVLPAAALRVLGWEKGDFLLIYLHNKNAIVATRFDPEKRRDLLFLARESEEKLDEVLPTIKV